MKGCIKEKFFKGIGMLIFLLTIMVCGQKVVFADDVTYIDVEPNYCKQYYNLEEGKKYVFNLKMANAGKYKLYFIGKRYDIRYLDSNGGEGIYDEGVVGWDWWCTSKGNEIEQLEVFTRETGTASMEFYELDDDTRIRVEPVINGNQKGLKYDLKNHILTLDNYNGGEIIIHDERGYEKETECSSVIIVVNGDNTLDGAIWGYNINLKIVGNGSLNFVNDGSCNSSIDVEGSLVIDGPVLNIKNYDYPIYVNKGSIKNPDKENDMDGTLTIKSGVINVEYGEIGEEPRYINSDCFFKVEEMIKLEGGTINIMKNIREPLNFYSTIYRVFSSKLSHVEYVNCDITLYGFADFKESWIVYNIREEEREKQKYIPYKFYNIENEVLFNIPKDFKLEKTEYLYEGKPIKPEVIPPEGIKKGCGYYVTYKDNDKAGTGKVIIKGLYDKSLSQELEFKIVDSSKKSVETKQSSKSSYEYSGKVNVGSKIKIISANGIYKITKIIKKKGKITGGNLQFVRPIKRNVKTVKIVDNIKINGVKYKVTSIGKKAFAKCKKLKMVKIKSKRVLKFKKSALKGAPKKIKFVVDKKLMKKYKKALKKLGLSKKVKL
ncbi:hypothetical protein SAMN02745111_01688 [Eubacterium uniforme]|uniref:Leucine rich repeat-containing protein n=1 Tax=Eubacterium uniforme TaxID=39495 RepID=A0A1T4VV93_9FIRM|nr:hypothetical protein [Eubacterium uniforme]SKA68934.1 hypothetical protein SAMN02745111_01688 [Eubacterium uniforme]